MYKKEKLNRGMKVGTSKEKIKMGIKNQLKTILHMLTFNIVTIIMLIFGNCWSTSIETLGGIIVEANMFVFLCCMIILLFVYTIFWRKLLKKDLKKDIEIHQICVIAFIILYILFLLVQCFIFLCSYNLFYAINKPNIIEFIVCVIYPIGYSIIDIIIDKKKHKDNETEIENS